MTDGAVTIRVSVEGDHVAFERLTGTSPRKGDKRKLHTEIKSLDAFEANVGTAHHLVSEVWGIDPHLVTFLDPNGNELHPV
jgi:hypothetical protein